MSMIIDQIKERAKKDKKTIILPEVMDRRVMEATEIILNEGIADIILVGRDEEIEETSRGFDIKGATIVNPYTSELTDELVEKLYDLRKEKGMTLDGARELLLGDYMYYACMLRSVRVKLELVKH